MERVFTVLEVPEEKKVNIDTFYLTREVDIWWNTVKDKLSMPSFTWRSFLEVRAQFYPGTIQWQKDKEFLELKMSDNMIVMRYACKLIELSWFVPKCVASEMLKMRKFDKGLAVCIHNQLAGQPICPYQELCERAVEVERVKVELRALNPNLSNQNRKWNEQGAPSESVN